MSADSTPFLLLQGRDDRQSFCPLSRLEPRGLNVCRQIKSGKNWFGRKLGCLPETRTEEVWVLGQVTRVGAVNEAFLGEMFLLAQ